MSDGGPRRDREAPIEEPPPILGRWSRLYAVVLLNLAILIVLFTWFTWSFR